MTVTGALDRGRESFRRQSWADAYAQLAAADRDAPLEVADLEMLAAAASLAGDDPASSDAWVRAHQEYVRAGDPARAVRCAFWLVLGLMLRGELAPAAGWLARGQRFAGDVEGHAEEGCLLLGDAVQLMFVGDAEGANASTAARPRSASASATRTSRRWRDSVRVRPRSCSDAPPTA